MQEHDNSVIDGSGNTTLLSSDSGSVRDVSQSSSVIVRRSKTSSNLPFRVQLHDPALCLDIIDDMYDIYFKKQVSYTTLNNFCNLFVDFTETYQFRKSTAPILTWRFRMILITK